MKSIKLWFSVIAFLCVACASLGNRTPSNEASAIRALPVDCDQGLHEPAPNIQLSDWQIFCRQYLHSALLWPPEELIKSLTGNPDSGVTVVTTLLPHGRSPERFYTDFENPRVLISWNEKEIEGQPQTHILLGYTSKLHQFEVISHNRNTGENEFRVIRDYDGVNTPQVEIKNRFECMSCHRGGNAIFSVVDWTETPSNQKIFDELKKKDEQNKLESSSQFLLFKTHLVGARHPHAQLTANSLFRVDDRVRLQFNMSPTYACTNLCESGQGETDLGCRKRVIIGGMIGSLSFRPLLGEVNDRLKWRLEYFWGEYKVKNRRNISVLSLGNRRNPMVPFEQDSDWDLASDPLIFNSYVSDPQTEEFIGPERIAYGAACFRFTKDQLRQIGAMDNESPLEELFRSPELATLAAKYWLPDEKFLLNEVERINGKPLKMERARPSFPLLYKQEPIGSYSWRKGDYPGGEKVTDAAALFTMACLNCHADQRSIGKMLPFEDLSPQALKNLGTYKGAYGRTVKELLQNFPERKERFMPPVHSPYYMPTKSQVQIMLNAIGA